MRKTIEVKWIVEHVNQFNISSKDEQKEQRIAKNLLLEAILHETGSYNGFSYLNWLDFPKDGIARTPGINYDKDGSMLPYDAGDNARFEGTDSSRVYYFYRTK